MMTVYSISANCIRCDRPLYDAITRHLNKGDSAQCPHCSLLFQLTPAAIAEGGGYNEGDDYNTDPV